MAISVSLVSYFNTLPFLYGLEQFDAGATEKSFILNRQYPARCADLLMQGTTDVGLVPSATFLEDDDLILAADFCIGAQGKVDSVLLLSNDGFDDIKEVFLDFQSKTSNLLLKILAKHYWKRKWNYRKSEEGFEQHIPAGSAAVVIGDKAFAVRDRYTTCVDLSEMWQQMTGLPFVFAVWAMKREHLNNKDIDSLKTALQFGVDNIDSVCKLHEHSAAFDLHDYLKHKIQFTLDGDKRTAFELYLAYAKSLED